MLEASLIVEKRNYGDFMEYVYITIIVIMIGVIRLIPLPDRRWYRYRPSAEQLFSDMDEEVTRRVNDAIR